MATVSRDQRFTRGYDCPVCAGNDNDRRKKGTRCNGYLMEDGKGIVCGREEYSQDCPQVTTSPPGWLHIPHGQCRCGQDHSSGAEPRPAALLDKTRKNTGPSVVHKAIPAHDRDTGWPLISTYVYRDEAGAELYAVARYEGAGDKTFKQYRAVPGGWSAGLPDTRRVLYRLPELLAAPSERTVFITEGEKNGEAIAALGEIVTTNCCGAGGWAKTVTPEELELLRGRPVVIFEDNDQAGRARTQEIAQSLQGVAASISIVRFADKPEGYDVSDYLEAGGTLLGLLCRVEAWTSPAVAEAVPEQTEDSGVRGLLWCVLGQLQTSRQSLIRMNEELRWYREIVTAPDVDETDKVVRMGIQHTLTLAERGVLDCPKDEEGRRMVPASLVASVIHSSPSTVIRSYGKLGNDTAFDVKQQPGRGQSGYLTNQYWLKPGEGNARPHQWSSGKSEHGGKREGAGRKSGQCKHCQSTNTEQTIIKQTVTRQLLRTHCHNCGCYDEESYGAETIEATEIVANYSAPLDSQDGQTFFQDENISPSLQCNQDEKMFAGWMDEPLNARDTVAVKARRQAYLDAGLNSLETQKRLDACRRSFINVTVSSSAIPELQAVAMAPA